MRGAQSKMIVALIPARSGSKRVPGKNIRELGGKMLFEYSIEVAKLCPSIDRVYVSTNSHGYADLASHSGARVIMRPAAYSDDDANDYSVVSHFMRNEKAPPRIDKIVYLRPTTPLRKVYMIERAISIMENMEEEGMLTTGLRSVEEMTETAYKSFIMPGGLYIMGISCQSVDEAGGPNDHYQRTYKGNGYVDIILPDQIQYGDLFGGRCIGFKTEPVTEVDTEREFKLLEWEIQQGGGHVY